MIFTNILNTFYFVCLVFTICICEFLIYHRGRISEAVGLVTLSIIFAGCLQIIVRFEKYVNDMGNFCRSVYILLYIIQFFITISGFVVGIINVYYNYTYDNVNQYFEQILSLNEWIHSKNPSIFLPCVWDFVGFLIRYLIFVHYEKYNKPRRDILLVINVIITDIDNLYFRLLEGISSIIANEPNFEDNSTINESLRAPEDELLHPSLSPVLISYPPPPSYNSVFPPKNNPPPPYEP